MRGLGRFFAIALLFAGLGLTAWPASLGGSYDHLPIGAPMTYVSSITERQYAVIAAGGSARSKGTGDSVIAFALPNKP